MPKRAHIAYNLIRRTCPLVLTPPLNSPRHRAMHELLWAGLTPLGLKPFVENADDRLITVNTIKVRPRRPEWCHSTVAGENVGQGFKKKKKKRK